MKNNDTFREWIAPVVVLVSICLVITTALAATYRVTKPIIDTNSRKAADKVRRELLQDADSFKEYDGTLVAPEEGRVFVKDCYVAENKCGMVVTVSTKSFGGALTEMIGIDKNGKITGVKVTDHSDTPGVGTKAHVPGHLDQYKGLDKLSSISAKEDPAIRHVTGATVSSNGIHYGVYCALEQFKAMGGVR